MATVSTSSHDGVIVGRGAEAHSDLQRTRMANMIQCLEPNHGTLGSQPPVRISPLSAAVGREAIEAAKISQLMGRLL